MPKVRSLPCPPTRRQGSKQRMPGCAVGRSCLDLGVSQDQGYLEKGAIGVILGGSHRKSCSVLGPILGSQYFGKLLCLDFLNCSADIVLDKTLSETPKP